MSKDRIRVHDRALEELRAHGLRFPGAHLKSPWPEHKDLAVNDKTFAYMGHGGDALGLSCKLPHSNREALMLEGATPGAYGLGKSGWVAITFPLESDPPVEMLKEWLEESYRAQAPKKLVKQLDAERGGASEPVGKAPNKKAPNKKATAKKAAAKKAPTKKAAATKAPTKRPASKMAPSKRPAATKGGTEKVPGSKGR